MSHFVVGLGTGGILVEPDAGNASIIRVFVVVVAALPENVYERLSDKF